MSLHRYDVRLRLGSSPFGTVYQAYDEANREVTFVVLDDPQADDIDVDELESVYDRLGQIDDPRIPRVHEVVRHEGRPALVRAFVPGVDLNWAHTSSSLPPDAARAVVGEVARALAQAHAVGVSHGDLTIDNVVVTAEGGVVVIDFGLAVSRPAAKRKSSDIALYGSLGYLPPERAAGAVSPAGDVYALGALLYELLTHDRVSATPAERGAHDERGERMGVNLSHAMGPDVVELVSEAMSFDPDRRPTAAGFAERCGADLDALKAWASEVVPALDASRHDNPLLVGGELVGHHVVATSRGGPGPVLGPLLAVIGAVMAPVFLLGLLLAA